MSAYHVFAISCTFSPEVTSFGVLDKASKSLNWCFIHSLNLLYTFNSVVGAAGAHPDTTPLYSY